MWSKKKGKLELLPKGLIVLFASLSYMNSLNGDFVFDDAEAILKNQDVKAVTSLMELFQNDFWGSKLSSEHSHKSYRPLTVLTFRLNFFFNGTNPFFFHLTNLVLHCFISFYSINVFYILFDCLNLAVVSSTLFAAHPVHTEAVSGIVGRADLLSCLFVFLAFTSYRKCMIQEQQEPTLFYKSNNNSRKQKFLDNSKKLKINNFVINYGCVVVFTTVSVLCKEIGITVLGICFAYDLIENQKILFHLFRNLYCSQSKVAWKDIRPTFYRVVFLIVLSVLILVFRWIVMGSSVPLFTTADNPASFIKDFRLRILNYHYIYALNFLLFVFPHWLCFDWSMGCLPLIESFADYRIIAVILFWIVVGLIFFRAIKFKSKEDSQILIALSFIAIPFLPASNVFFRVGFVIAERILYIPVTGFCIIITIGINKLYASKNGKLISKIFFAWILLFYVIKSTTRTNDWKNEKTLFTSGLKVCPLNAKVHYNIGKVLADEGKNEKAKVHYYEALRLNEKYDQAMNNLANILKNEGRYIEAEELLVKAVSTRHDFASAWMNLGIVQAQLKNFSKAEKSYKTALKHRTVYPDCLYNLGNLHLSKGEHDEALKCWFKAVELKPTLEEAWTNILILLDAQENYEKAIKVADEALQRIPEEPSIHFNLANTLGKLNRFEASEKSFLRSIELDNSNANYFSNLGVLYHRWKKYEKAKSSYEKALFFNPNLKSARSNLNMVNRVIEKQNFGSENAFTE